MHQVHVIRRSRVAPLIVTIERARKKIAAVELGELRRQPEPEYGRTNNEWTPKSCLGQSLKGLSVMALEVPLAILYAAQRRAIARGVRIGHEARRLTSGRAIAE
jgi:hypothetical protein